MAKKIISVRVEANTKQQAEQLFDEMGLSMSAAVNIFLKQVIRTGTIPFEISMKEAKRMRWLTHDMFLDIKQECEAVGYRMEEDNDIVQQGIGQLEILDNYRFYDTEEKLMLHIQKASLLDQPESDYKVETIYNIVTDNRKTD